MPHVLVAGRIHRAGLDLLRTAPDVTLDVVDEVSVAAFAPKLPGADALLIRTQPLDAALIASANRLRMVSRHGVGYDAIDVAALSTRGIPLSLVGDVNSRTVAEQTMALMLALAKRVTAHDHATRTGGWALRNSFSATELHGKTLLLVGFGRIGRLVAGMAQAFGMHILAHDPFQSEEAIHAGGAEPAPDLDAALPRADFVSLHLPKAGDRPLIGASELARLKPTAFVVNTARGGLIDEEALADALHAGRLAGAGLDVFGDEPPQAENRLLSSDRTTLSPHIAGLTAECAARMGQVAARNILDFFAGRLDPSLVVNRELLKPTAEAHP